MAGSGVVGLVFDEAGFDDLLERLKGLAASDRAELAEFAGAELHRVAVKAFEAEADPLGGEKWEGLKRPRRDGSTRPVLQDGGQLRRSLTWEADALLGGAAAVVGSGMAYARVHQEGGRAGRRRAAKIPRRRFLGVPDGFGRRLLGDPAVKRLLGVA